MSEELTKYNKIAILAAITIIGGGLFLMNATNMAKNLSSADISLTPDLKSGLNKISIPEGYKTQSSGTNSSNLTAQYSSWLESQGLPTDTGLNYDQIDKFLQENTDLNVPLANIDITDINVSLQSGPEANQKYLDDISKIQLPFASLSYIDVAKEAANGNYVPLDETLQKLDEVSKNFKAVETPLEAFEIQRTYLAAFEFLKSMFNDLRSAKEDPVRVLYNAKRGEKLAKIIQDLEIKKQALNKNAASQENPIK